ncbi:hypothetical protein BGZ97_009443 [Linnemannia gamsii]|uniref:Uncharacterized protein n=1 Tax=Linnemannia gamsii TaxID=64522 RepID=A0A9P6QQ74_9FUNG|nr:hypothetical protein BGZ97_009443 [Linnemannia gamsii]
MREDMESGADTKAMDDLEAIGVQLDPDQESGANLEPSKGSVHLHDFYGSGLNNTHFVLA